MSGRARLPPSAGVKILHAIVPSREGPGSCGWPTLGSGTQGLLEVSGWACPRLRMSMRPASESVGQNAQLRQVAPGKAPSQGLSMNFAISTAVTGPLPGSRPRLGSPPAGPTRPGAASPSHVPCPQRGRWHAGCAAAKTWTTSSRIRENRAAALSLHTGVSSVCRRPPLRPREWQPPGRSPQPARRPWALPQPESPPGPRTL